MFIYQIIITNDLINVNGAFNHKTIRFDYDEHRHGENGGDIIKVQL